MPRRLDVYAIIAIVLMVAMSPFIITSAPSWMRKYYPDNAYVKKHYTETLYFVHIRAELTIDTEALVLDRNFRCFRFAPRTGNVFPSGDSLFGATSKGRSFAILIPSICETLVSRFVGGADYKGDGGYDRLDIGKDEITPLRMSKQDIQTPVVFEVHGGRRKPTQVDAYISATRLRQGYHGVQLNELLIEQANIKPEAWDYKAERQETDWFGVPTWFRPQPKNVSSYYLSGFIVAMPESDWRDPIKLAPPRERERRIQQGGQKYADEFVSMLRNAKSDLYFTKNQNFSGTIGYFDHVGFTQTVYSLRNASPNHQIGNGRFEYAWARDRIIPCRFEGKGNYICSPEMDGVLQYKPVGPLADVYQFDAQIGDGNFFYKMPGFTFNVVGGRGSLFRVADQTFYSAYMSDIYLRRDEQ